MFEKTLWGTYEKELEAIALLKAHEPPEGYYVAYSGGKDSTVILDLVRRSGVKYDAHYNVTTVDPPELIKHIRKQTEVICDPPKVSMWDLIATNGPPTRIRRFCCRYLKERGGNRRVIVTGVRAAESSRRAKRQKVEPDLKDATKSYIHLIFDWTTNEVWDYIRSHELEYCSLYDEGFKRIGCLICPMAYWKRRLQEAERWPKYKEAYIRAFEKYLEYRKERGKPTTWQTGQDVWDWWISG